MKKPKVNPKAAPGVFLIQDARGRLMRIGQPIIFEENMMSRHSSGPVPQPPSLISAEAFVENDTLYIRTLSKDVKGVHAAEVFITIDGGDPVACPFAENYPYEEEYNDYVNWTVPVAIQNDAVVLLSMPPGSIINTLGVYNLQIDNFPVFTGAIYPVPTITAVTVVGIANEEIHVSFSEQMDIEILDLNGWSWVLSNVVHIAKEGSAWIDPTTLSLYDPAGNLTFDPANLRYTPGATPVRSANGVFLPDQSIEPIPFP